MAGPQGTGVGWQMPPKGIPAPSYIDPPLTTRCAGIKMVMEKQSKSKNGEKSKTILGSQDGTNPFKRSSLLGRSPPRERSMSWTGPMEIGETEKNKENAEVVHDDDDGKLKEPEIAIRQSTKRIRVDSPPQSSNSQGLPVTEDLKELKALMSKLDKNSRDMMNAIKITPNTKAEIKKGVGNIAQIVEVVLRRWTEWEDSYKDVSVEANSSKQNGSGMPTDQTRQNTKSTRDAWTQIDMDGEGAHIESTVMTGSSFQDYGQVLDKEWPDHVYKKTKLIKENPARTSNKKDLVIVINPKDDGTKGLLKDIKERYPYIAEIADEKMQEGRIEFIQLTTKTCTSKREQSEGA